MCRKRRHEAVSARYPNDLSPETSVEVYLASAFLKYARSHVEYFGKAPVDSRSAAAWDNALASESAPSTTPRICSRGGAHEIDQCHKCGAIFAASAIAPNTEQLKAKRDAADRAYCIAANAVFPADRRLERDEKVERLRQELIAADEELHRADGGKETP